MTVMWSACSFTIWLITFMNKSLEGTIFINNYYESIAGAVASICGSQIYGKLGLRTFTLGFSLVIVGATLIYLLESGAYLPPPWYLELFTGTLKMKKVQAIDALVPRIAFVSKFGMHLANLGSYQASFSDDTIFPPDKRASSIGFC